MDLKYQAVSTDNWSDFESLFECKGSPHYCWCMAWRKNENKKTTPGKAGKKLSIKRRVDEQIPIGLLAYLDEKPIAWCSIAPRETHRSLGGDESKKNVWSLTCFFIKREFRNKGVASMLLKAAIKHAKKVVLIMLKRTLLIQVPTLQVTVSWAIFQCLKQSASSI